MFGKNKKAQQPSVVVPQMPMMQDDSLPELDMDQPQVQQPQRQAPQAVEPDPLLTEQQVYDCLVNHEERIKAMEAAFFRLRSL